MVVSLGPGKFYGSSLPRPRIYTDVKFNDGGERVDPPVPVMDALLSWANEAHWSMGGLSFQRLRFQGRIEGNVARLRKLREKQEKLKAKNSPVSDRAQKGKKRVVGSVSPPPAPVASKRRRFMDLFDESEEEEEEEEVVVVEKVERKRRPARKLVGEFEKVAEEGGDGRRRKAAGVDDVVMSVVKEVNRESSVGRKQKKVKGDEMMKKDTTTTTTTTVRTSPRLAKQRSN
ncbi:hypothetical protein Tsubulata_017602 [Turnera subulata]|uniref:Uncharacterized protein n=1 Tax=Turnera subulata TaxID=218843 RepID=A0A9Q0F1F0_9ROSI|nr:hypothetical protein Tsubulata_017602 [Turnera subulata]